MLLTLITFSAYECTLNRLNETDAFKAASSYVVNNSELNALVGAIKNHKIARVGKNEVWSNFAETGSKAIFSIAITGERGEGILFVELTQVEGQWRVVKSNFQLD